MADARAGGRAPELLAISRRVVLGAIVVLALAAAAGVAMALSPLLIAVLAGAVIVPAVASLLGRMARRGPEAVPSRRAVLGHFALSGLVVLAVIQLVPYGRDHANPPVTGEPAWSSPRTRQLMVDACYDCHSNEVEWPWYTNIAPLSWAVTDHVEEGRRAVNYSEFTTGGDHEADETLEVVLEGSMPPYYYTLFGLHPDADLSRDEIAELVAGLRSTPGLAEDEARADDEDDD